MALQDLFNTLAVAKVANNENPELCRACGGVCCKNMGCPIFPSDVRRWFGKQDITEDDILDLLSTGCVALDWWEGDIIEDTFDIYDDIGRPPLDESYFLRMRHCGEEAVHRSYYGGRCVLLTYTGCPLTWDERPLGAQSVIPVEESGCEAVYGKAECAAAWVEFEDILEDLRYKVRNVSYNMDLDALRRIVSSKK